MILSKINQRFPPIRFLDASMSLKIVWQTTHKRQDCTVPHPNRLNRFPSEQWIRFVTSKKTKFNRFPSQQRTRHCYFEKDKTELLPVSTKNSSLLLFLHISNSFTEECTLRSFWRSFDTHVCGSQMVVNLCFYLTPESNFYDNFENQLLILQDACWPFHDSKNCLANYAH